MDLRSYGLLGMEKEKMTESTTRKESQVLAFVIMLGALLFGVLVGWSGHAYVGPSCPSVVCSCEHDVKCSWTDDPFKVNGPVEWTVSQPTDTVNNFFVGMDPDDPKRKASNDKR